MAFLPHLRNRKWQKLMAWAWKIASSIQHLPPPPVQPSSPHLATPFSTTHNWYLGDKAIWYPCDVTWRFGPGWGDRGDRSTQGTPGCVKYTPHVSTIGKIMFPYVPVPSKHGTVQWTFALGIQLFNGRYIHIFAVRYTFEVDRAINVVFSPCHKPSEPSNSATKWVIPKHHPLLRGMGAHSKPRLSHGDWTTNHQPEGNIPTMSGFLQAQHHQPRSRANLNHNFFGRLPFRSWLNPNIWLSRRVWHSQELHLQRLYRGWGL